MLIVRKSTSVGVFFNNLPKGSVTSSVLAVRLASLPIGLKPVKDTAVFAVSLGSML